MPESPSRKEQAAAASELFHKLGQPLTALQCSLELALRKDLSRTEYRQVIESALQLSQVIIRTTTEERDLADAELAGAGQSFNFQHLAAETVDVLGPVAKSEGKGLHFFCDGPAFVMGDRLRMQKAVFGLIEFLLHNTPDHRHLCFVLINDGSLLHCYLGETWDWATSPLGVSMGLMIENTFPMKLASRTFAAAGGGMFCKATGITHHVMFWLPLAHANHVSAEIRIDFSVLGRSNFVFMEF